MTPGQGTGNPAVRAEAVPIRGTQSLVVTLSRCWQRPSLTGIEVLWRWVFGVPALWIVLGQLRKILLAHTDGTMDVARLGLDRVLTADPVGAAAADPLGISAKVATAIGIVLPDIQHAALWIVPALMLYWVVVSSIGRTVLLRRMDPALHARLATLMVLQAMRMIAVVGMFGAWFGCLKWVSRVAIAGPVAAGQEPNLVLYFAMMIVATLGMFTAWAVVSWVLAIAPLAAMLKGAGVFESLKASFRLGGLKAKLIEVNLVLGIVKIGLIVLGMVFSATPLPFETATTPEFLRGWWIGVTLLYFIGSDFFHVVRLRAYLDLWRQYEQP
ncbi:hypothetical protein BH10ACI4_BH10ACI4_35140 [soil metagenome]